MRTRGYALILALVALAVLFTAALLLSRGMMSRMSAQRTFSQREAALRQAESSLERARAALEDGSLQPGAAYKADGADVACAVTPRGVRLEARALLDAQPSNRPRLRRAVRVAWEMERDEKAGQAAAWRRVGWSARSETVTPAR